MPTHTHTHTQLHYTTLFVSGLVPTAEVSVELEWSWSGVGVGVSLTLCDSECPDLKPLTTPTSGLGLERPFAQSFELNLPVHPPPTA